MASGWIPWGILGAAASLVLTSAVVGWMFKGRATPPSKSGTLTQPRNSLVLGWVCTVVFSGLTLAQFITGAVWSAVATGPIALFSVYWVVDAYRTRYVIHPDGMQYVTGFTRGGYAKWSDVTHIVYSETGFFQVDFVNGSRLRLSTTLQGLPTFASAVLQSVKPESIDAETLVLLEATSMGRAPTYGRYTLGGKGRPS
jgi:hypothetical protein